MFRDGRPRCPSCADESALITKGSWLSCEHCLGVLIPTDEVESMVSSLRVEPFVLPTGTDGDRTCPSCTSKLAKLLLLGVEVDRCAAHGVWFDTKELTNVLEAASGVDPTTIPEPAERGLLGKLFSLFGSRHDLPWSVRRPPDDK
jgi:Zn-finger nucleic acid-binding protein